MAGSWLSKNILIPVLQALVAGGVMAAGVVGIKNVKTAITGCEAAVRPTVIAGNRELHTGRIEQASRFAQDAIAINSKSPCANQLAAEVAIRQMASLQRIGRQKGAEVARIQCLDYALKAKPVLTSPAEVEAIVGACRTQGF